MPLRFARDELSLLVFLIAEQHANAHLDRIERLGTDRLACRRALHDRVTIVRPAVEIHQPPGPRLPGLRLNGSTATPSLISAWLCCGDGIAFWTISPLMISSRSGSSQARRSSNVAGFRSGTTIETSLAYQRGGRTFRRVSRDDLDVASSAQEADLRVRRAYASRPPSKRCCSRRPCPRSPWSTSHATSRRWSRSAWCVTSESPICSSRPTRGRPS